MIDHAVAERNLRAAIQSNATAKQTIRARLSEGTIPSREVVGCDEVAWVKPAYPRERVNQAGFVYVDPASSAKERELALTVITNWRSAHNWPLNTIQTSLRRNADDYDRDATVAQRIKRLPSIRHKLERIPGMKLARMQDIGGCRAVLSDVEAVDELTAYYQFETRMKHKLVREDRYILHPQESGYRGTHLVFSYYSDRNAAWNGLRVEIQIRTRLQHAWATAVETVGTFTRQALKSSQGEGEWLRFFALMSSALARREGTPPVPGTPASAGELRRELREYAKRLDVITRLNAYGHALRFAESEMAATRGHTYLLELDIASQTLAVTSYPNPAVAAEEYSAIERAIEGDPTKDAVLVSVASLASLRRAFPNYFLDTTAFVDAVREAIS